MTGANAPRAKVWFVGAGPGAADLLTLRAAAVIGAADVVVWASSLVHADVLGHARQDAEIVDSAALPLEDVRALYERALAGDLVVARIHSGDPALWGAVQEQRELCDELGLPHETIPGVSAYSAVAALAERELTIPELAQSVILTRLGGGKTPMPAGEEIAELARHGTTMAVFLSAARSGQLQAELLAGLPGDLARRADRGLHRGHAGGDGPRPQAVEAHAVPGRARAGGVRHPVSPLPPGPFPLPPPGRPGGAGRPAHRRRRPAGGLIPAGWLIPAGRPGHERVRAMTTPGPGEPELREPDLPRTAKVRPRALRTGWTTGTCASAAAKAATTALRDQATQRTVAVALPSGRRVAARPPRSWSRTLATTPTSPTAPISPRRSGGGPSPPWSSRAGRESASSPSPASASTSANPRSPLPRVR